MNNHTNISKEQFYNVHQQNPEVVLIDVRSQMEYQTKHIKNSFNIPLDDISIERVSRLFTEHELPKDGCVYLICKSGRRSKMAQQKLEDLPRSIICIDGGIDDMEIDRSLQFNHSSSKVISLERQVRIAIGSFTVTGVILGSFVHPAGYFLSAFVGIGLMFSGITDWCGMGLLIAKMPWNKV
jgi:rhodanese-related sulfurtransferase